MFWFKSCSRCGGDLYQDRDVYGTYVACLQCGHHLNPAQEAALGKPASAAARLRGPYRPRRAAYAAA